MQALKKKLQRQEKVVHVPKVMQHERQGCSQKYRVTARQLGHTSWRQPVSKEVVHLPVKQHVEQVVQAPVVLDPVFECQVFPCQLEAGIHIRNCALFAVNVAVKISWQKASRVTCNLQLQAPKSAYTRNLFH